MNKINSILGLTSKNEIIEKINVELIVPNPYQPRQVFDRENLEELAVSVRQYGILQPVLVRKFSPKQFQLIAGERRFRAAKMAGLAEVPAIIKDLSDNEVAEIAIIENLQRENLNFFEEAEGFKKLIETFSLTQEEVALKVGKSQSVVANKLRLLRLSPAVKDQISTEVLTERHIRALLKVKEEHEQLFILDKIYQSNLNVKQTEEFITNFLENKKDQTDKEKVTIKEKKQNITDYRLFQNTIKKSLENIEFSGAKTEYQDRVLDDYLEVTIKIYK